MGPVLDALDSMSKATIEQPPSTAYQKAFHAGLAPRIQKATAALWKAASKGFSSAPEAQGILEQITTAVEQHCRSACHIIIPLWNLVTAPHCMSSVHKLLDCRHTQVCHMFLIFMWHHGG